MTRKVLSVLILSLLQLSHSVHSFAAPRRAKVGVILPLSGDLAIYGEKVRQGIELVLPQFADNVELIFEDGKDTSASGLAAFQKLTALDKVKIIIGPFGANQTLPVAELAERDGVLLMAVSMCEERYKKFPLIFCTYPAPQDQMQPLYRLFEKHGDPPKTMALIFEEAAVTAVIRESVREFAKRTGIKIVSEQIFSTTDKDFVPYVLRVRQTKPDLLAVGGFPANTVQIFRDAKKLGLHTRYRWFLSEQDTQVFAENAELLEGTFLTGTPHESNPAFTEKFAARFKKTPDLYHALGYDAALVLFSALEKAADLDTRKLAMSLTKLEVANTANPEFRFDHNRTVKLALDPSIISGGKQKLLLIE